MKLILLIFSLGFYSRKFSWCNIDIDLITFEHELVKYTPQWLWLYNELKRVDREKTPWLIIIMHAPIYNSNEAHYMEGESIRAVFESWFVHYKVDLVFAGHVHAYERSVFLLFLSTNMMASYKYSYLNFIYHFSALKNHFLMAEF